MTTVLAPMVESAPRKATPWNRVKAGARRRSRRIEWIVLVLVMLVPQLVIALLFAD